MKILTSALLLLTVLLSAVQVQAVPIIPDYVEPYPRPQVLACSDYGAISGFLDLIDGFGSGINTNDECDHHDLCYATIGADRLACDQAFKSNLRSNCSSTYQDIWEIAEKALCKEIAGAAYDKLREAGQGNFDKAQARTKKLLDDYGMSVRWGVPEDDVYPWEDIDHVSDPIKYQVYLRALDTMEGSNPSNVEYWQSYLGLLPLTHEKVSAVLLIILDE